MGTKLVQVIKKHKADIIVISLILTVSIAILLVINAIQKPGSIAVVEIDGVKAGEYSLSKDAVYELNGGTNVLVIEDGQAYLNYSDCPDHTCEKTGKIRYVGETIICLPNRVSITIKGNTDDAVDLVS